MLMLLLLLLMLAADPELNYELIRIFDRLTIRISPLLLLLQLDRCCYNPRRRTPDPSTATAVAAAPAVAADLSTVVVAAAADPELCQSAD